MKEKIRRLLSMVFGIIIGLTYGYSQCASEEYSSYQPDPTDPVITVRTNFIFMQKNDGTGNFQEDNEDHQDFIDDVVDQINNFLLSNNRDSIDGCYSGPCNHILDSRIRIQVTKMFVRDTYGWNNLNDLDLVNGCPSTPNWYLLYLHDSINNDSNILDAANIFFTYSQPHLDTLLDCENQSAMDCQNGSTPNDRFCISCSMSADTTAPFEEMRVHMRDSYHSFAWNLSDCSSGTAGTGYNNARNSMAINVLHEIGHLFFNRFSSGSGSYGIDQNGHVNNCPTNLMNTDFDDRTQFLSPLQLGEMHYALENWNISNYVVECENTYTFTTTSTFGIHGIYKATDYIQAKDSVIIDGPSRSVILQAGDSV